MQAFIRFVGILNAALWFGAVVFFTIAAGPAFFSAEVATFLPRPHAGRMAEVVITRLVSLQQWCAVIALLHVLLERLYAGRRPARWVVGSLVTLLALNLLAGTLLLPKMHALQRVRYSPASTEIQRTAAVQSFGLWHGVSSVFNLAIIGALGLHLWYLTHSSLPGKYSR